MEEYCIPWLGSSIATKPVPTESDVFAKDKMYWIARFENTPQLPHIQPSTAHEFPSVCDIRNHIHRSFGDIVLPLPELDLYKDSVAIEALDNDYPEIRAVTCPEISCDCCLDAECVPQPNDIQSIENTELFVRQQVYVEKWLLAQFARPVSIDMSFNTERIMALEREMEEALYKPVPAQDISDNFLMNDVPLLRNQPNLDEIEQYIFEPTKSICILDMMMLNMEPQNCNDSSCTVEFEDAHMMETTIESRDLLVSNMQLAQLPTDGLPDHNTYLPHIDSIEQLLARDASNDIVQFCLSCIGADFISELDIAFDNINIEDTEAENEQTIWKLDFDFTDNKLSTLPHPYIEPYHQATIPTPKWYEEKLALQPKMLMVLATMLPPLSYTTSEYDFLEVKSREVPSININIPTHVNLDAELLPLSLVVIPEVHLPTKSNTSKPRTFDEDDALIEQLLRSSMENRFESYFSKVSQLPSVESFAQLGKDVEINTNKPPQIRTLPSQRQTLPNTPKSQRVVPAKMQSPPIQPKVDSRTNRTTPKSGTKPRPLSGISSPTIDDAITDYLRIHGKAPTITQSAPVTIALPQWIDPIVQRMPVLKDIASECLLHSMCVVSNFSNFDIFLASILLYSSMKQPNCYPVIWLSSTYSTANAVWRLLSQAFPELIEKSKCISSDAEASATLINPSSITFIFIPVSVLKSTTRVHLLRTTPWLIVFDSSATSCFGRQTKLASAAEKESRQLIQGFLDAHHGSRLRPRVLLLMNQPPESLVNLRVTLTSFNVEYLHCLTTSDSVAQYSPVIAQEIEINESISQFVSEICHSVIGSKFIDTDLRLSFHYPLSINIRYRELCEMASQRSYPGNKTPTDKGLTTALTFCNKMSQLRDIVLIFGPQPVYQLLRTPDFQDLAYLQPKLKFTPTAITAFDYIYEKVKNSSKSLILMKDELQANIMYTQLKRQFATHQVQNWLICRDPNELITASDITTQVIVSTPHGVMELPAGWIRTAQVYVLCPHEIGAPFESEGIVQLIEAQRVTFVRAKVKERINCDSWIQSLRNWLRENCPEASDEYGNKIIVKHLISAKIIDDPLTPKPMMRGSSTSSIRTTVAATHTTALPPKQPQTPISTNEAPTTIISETTRIPQVSQCTPNPHQSRPYQCGVVFSANMKDFPDCKKLLAAKNIHVLPIMATNGADVIVNLDSCIIMVSIYDYIPANPQRIDACAMASKSLRNTLSRLSIIYEYVYIIIETSCVKHVVFTTMIQAYSYLSPNGRIQQAEVQDWVRDLHIWCSGLPSKIAMLWSFAQKDACVIIENICSKYADQPFEPESSNTSVTKDTEVLLSLYPMLDPLRVRHLLRKYGTVDHVATLAYEQLKQDIPPRAAELMSTLTRANSYQFSAPKRQLINAIK